MDSSTSWIIESTILQKSVSTSSSDEDDTVDVDFDESSYIFRASNPHKFKSVAYVSILSGSSFVDKMDRPIRCGTTLIELEDDEILKAPCVTFVLVLKPFERISFCKSKEKVSMDEVHISTLSFKLNSHPDPRGMSQRIIPKLQVFPLRRKKERGFVCTQSVGGRLTHFFPESYHAVDFRCDEGTEVVAVADGVITDVTQSCMVSGIHCDNLSRWNSISLKMDNGFTADYVHIMPNSSRVKVGQRVRAGETLCLSGTIGFSPEPHLHFEIHRSDDLRGPSVLFEFEDFGNRTVRCPVAGEKY